MVKAYKYTVEGSGGDGQTWKAEGALICEFHDTLQEAMRQAFEKLTSGRAVYGRPGIGCRGPYDIHRFLIEQVKQ